MTRIPKLAPRVTVPRMALQAPKEEQGKTKWRDQQAPWRLWYRTTRWHKLRWHVLTEAKFTCAMCQRLEGRSAQLVADHIKAHKGDEALFWDRANIQCLCSSCHSSDKQRMERRAGFT